MQYGIYFIAIKLAPKSVILTMSYIIRSCHFWFQKGHGHVKCTGRSGPFLSHLKVTNVTYQSQGHKMQLKKTFDRLLPLNWHTKNDDLIVLEGQGHFRSPEWPYLVVFVCAFLAFPFSTHRLLSSQSWTT